MICVTRLWQHQRCTSSDSLSFASEPVTTWLYCTNCDLDHDRSLGEEPLGDHWVQVWLTCDHYRRSSTDSCGLWTDMSSLALKMVDESVSVGNTNHTSSASTSHSAPNWQMSQVDVSFSPVSAEPSPPAGNREKQRKTCDDWFVAAISSLTCCLKVSRLFPTSHNVTMRSRQVHLHSAIFRHNPSEAISFIHSLLPPSSTPFESLAWLSSISLKSPLISSESLFYFISLIFSLWECDDSLAAV